MGLAVTLNGSSVNFKPGILIQEKLTEDLDTGFLIIPQTTALTVEPLDQVVITDAISEIPYWTKYMLVSDIKRITSEFSTPKYNYELGLISPTIQLQRIVLPNRTITQPLTGSKTSIYTVLSRYVSMYASGFTISSALQTLTTNVDCPEFQWNRPTLFEVFNDLLSEVDAVVTMTSFTEISYLDLNTTGDAITATSNLTISDVELSQSAIDYASKLDAEVENAIYKKRNTRTIEWLTLKTTDDAIVTDDNLQLLLEKPVYKINSITAKVNLGGTSTDVYEADLTSRLIEKTEYELMETSNSTSYISGDYKRDRIYYTVGSNIIDGFSFNEDTFLSISSKKALINIFYNAYNEQNSVTLTMDNTMIHRFVFKVDYIAQETVKMASNKDVKNDSVLINSQDTSYVDFESFANKQQLTLNRIGNEKLTITGKASLQLTVPSLSDTYETDYKTAIREYSLYDSYVNYKLELYKNYVMKDIFTGLKQERRFTKIATEADALQSHHLTEYTLNFSNTDSTASAALENHLLKFAQADEDIRLILLKYTYASGSSADLAVSPSAYYTKNSLLLTYKMQDNFNAGYKVDASLAFTAYRYGLQYAPYVDDNGNFVSFTFKLYTDFVFSDLNVTSIAAADWSSAINQAREYPEIDTTELNSNDLIFTSGTNTRYKDNREITAESIQFNITSDSNIIIGYKFFENSALTYADTTDTTLYVAYSTTETYEEGDQTKIGTIAAAGNLTYSITNNGITINSPDSSITISELASWCICDSSGNIYIANNGNNDTIYLNKEV